MCLLCMQFKQQTDVFAVYAVQTTHVTWEMVHLALDTAVSLCLITDTYIAQTSHAFISKSAQVQGGLV